MQLVKCDKQLLKNFVNVLMSAGRADDATLTFSDEGIVSRVLDPSHVAMVDVRLAAADLVDISMNGSEIKVGVLVPKLKKAVGLVSSKIIAIDYDEKGKVLVLRAGRIELNFGLVSDSGDVEVRIPNIVFPASVVAKSEDLIMAGNAAKMMGDLVQIKLTKESLLFSCSGSDEKDRVEIDIPADDLEEFSMDDDVENLLSQFDLEFLLQTLKETNGNVRIQMGIDLPIRLEFPLGENGQVIYFLAPRVEGDD